MVMKIASIEKKKVGFGSMVTISDGSTRYSCFEGLGKTNPEAWDLLQRTVEGDVLEIETAATTDKQGRTFMNITNARKTDKAPTPQAATGGAKDTMIARETAGKVGAEVLKSFPEVLTAGMDAPAIVEAFIDMCKRIELYFISGE